MLDENYLLTNFLQNFIKASLVKACNFFEELKSVEDIKRHYMLKIFCIEVLKNSKSVRNNFFVVEAQ